MAVHHAKPPRVDKKDSKIEKPKNKNEGKVLLVAQEIKFAKTLAGNDKKARDKVLRNLKKWLTYRTVSSFEFSEHDFMRLWKGLFYCVWMSDKPLVQEDLCESISRLFECFGDKTSTAALFYKCFLKTMAQDWFGIDQHRIDKFLMLIRRMSRGALQCCRRSDWSQTSMEQLREALTGSGAVLAAVAPVEARLGLGLQMHLADLWMEEVAKVSAGELSAETVVELCRPFALYLCYGQEARLAGSIMRHVFTHLIRQTDLGVDYNERLLAWRNAGYPGGGMAAMQLVELSDNEDNADKDDDYEEKSRSKVGLDPRAGHVDVELPQLPVDGRLIAAMLQELVSDQRTTSSNRTRLRSLIQQFETLADGTYPFSMKELTHPDDSKLRLPKAAKAAQELLNFQDECRDLHEDDSMKGLNKRQRRKLLMKEKKRLEAGEMDDDDDDIEDETVLPPPKKSKKNKVEPGVWHVEDIKEGSEDILPESSKNASFKSTPLVKTKEIKSKNTNGKRNSLANKEIPLNQMEKQNGTIEVDESSEKGADVSKDKLVLENENKTPKSAVKAKKNNMKAGSPTGDLQKGNLSESKVATPQTTRLRRSTVNGHVDAAVPPLNLSSVLANNKSTLANVKTKLIKTSTPVSIKKTKKNDSENNSETPKKIIDTLKDNEKPQRRKSLRESIATPLENEKMSPLKKITPKTTPLNTKNNLSNTPAKSTPQKNAECAEEVEIVVRTRKNELRGKNKMNTSDSNIIKAKARIMGFKPNQSLDSSGQKKIMIALKKNTSHTVIDYFKSVRQSPEIPFDGEKKPLKTSLKPNSIPSPINPFYKRKLKLNF